MTARDPSEDRVDHQDTSRQVLSDLERVWVAHLHVLDVTERRLVHGVDVLLRDEDWRTFRDEQVSRARFLLSRSGVDSTIKALREREHKCQ